MLSTRHYAIIITSSVNHHDIVNTSPLRLRRIAGICLSHTKESPNIADSKSTSLTASVSRCSRLTVSAQTIMSCAVLDQMLKYIKANLLCVHEAPVGNYPEGNVCEIWSEL